MFGKIGCRAHDYGMSSMEELFTKIMKDDYQTMQLAFKKAFIEVGNLKEYLTVNQVLKISQCLKEKGLEVSVLGAYLNYAGLNDEKRNENLEVLISHLRIAKTLGCRMVGTETGSLDDEYQEHPDNHGELGYESFKDSVMKVLTIAKEEDVIFAIEPVATHIIHTPKRLHRLIGDIGNEHLKVIFDISNLITFENHKQQDEIMKEMFELMEEQILVVHVKDFDFVDGKKIIVPLGEGRVNLNLLMELVKKSSVVIDILAEDVEQEMLKKTYTKIKSLVD